MPFRDITGHRQLLSLLARAIARESLPPSLIFSGPSGIGKRLTAIATAQAVNCASRGSELAATSALELDACGECPACRRIARGVHPDVILVEPGETGSIKMEPVREVIAAVAYRPFEARRRVIIFDEADALVVQAQHALLKTLEEPPPASILILVTSRPDTLLPTVRSRCPQLRFQPLSPAEVAAVLVAKGQRDDEARAVAAVADGSIGGALTASGGDLSAARDAALHTLTSAATSDSPSRRSESAQALAAGSRTGGADRDELSLVLRAMASLVRDIEALGANAARESLANPDVLPALERLSAYRGERGVRAFETIDKALTALDRNAGVKIVADWVTVRL